MVMKASLETSFSEDYAFIGYYLDSEFNNKLPSEYHLDGHTNIYMKYEFTKKLRFQQKILSMMVILIH